MISKELAERVLFVGPASKYNKAGIATILDIYQSMCEIFHCISTYEKINGKVNHLTYFKAFIPFMGYMSSKRIQIVHIHGASNGSFWRKTPLILIARLFRKKVIFHCHGGGFKKFYKKHPRIIHHVLKQCNAIVALSPSWKEFFEKEIGCQNVYIIPNVIQKPEETNTLKDNNGFCNFLFLGKICKEKGVYDLIEAIGNNKEKYENRIKFFLGGNGHIDKMKELIDKYNVQNLFEYVGFISGKQKKELLKKCHIFILPSYYEGVPLSILEAMSYHMPVISTKVGGIPEIIENGKEGILIDPSDQVQIINSIDTTLEMREKWEEMGNYGYKRSTQHFPDIVEKKLKDLYLSF